MKIKEFNTFIRIYSFEIAIIVIVLVTVLIIAAAVTFTPNVETIDLSMVI